jgi:hypothetical protein
LAERADGGGFARRTMVAAGVAFERLDEFARRWTSASVLLLAVAGLFAWLMIQGSV